jgi:hypothetical protein
MTRNQPNVDFAPVAAYLGMQPRDETLGRAAHSPRSVRAELDGLRMTRAAVATCPSAVLSTEGGPGGRGRPTDNLRAKQAIAW